MKRSQSPFRVALAVILLLLLSLCPHHHHEGGAVCVTEEVCPADGNANDAHTSHGPEHQHDSHYCYWQPAPRIAPVQRVLPWGGGMPLAFLPVEATVVPLPQTILWGMNRIGCVPPPLLASYAGKLPVRRGPPVENV